MTDDDLRTLFASTTLRGCKPPADARLDFERTDDCTRVVASWQTRDRYEQHGFQVTHLVAIRRDGDPKFRTLEDINAEVRRAVVSLALICVESIEQRRVVFSS